LRDPVHHFEHSWDGILQHFCLFADNFVCNRVRKPQNALQLIYQVGQHVVVFVLFLQELDGQALPLLLMRQYQARTSNVALAMPKTAFETGFN
jgi:hypothetical protein